MPPKYIIHHWGRNMPRIKTERETRFREALVILALSGALIILGTLALLKAVAPDKPATIDGREAQP